MEELLNNVDNAVKTPEKKLPGIPFTSDDPRINRNGRPKGSLNWHTDMKLALQRIKNTKTGEEITEVDLVHTYLSKAIKGNDKILAEIIDRIYGKPTQTIVADVITETAPINAKTIEIAEEYEQKLKDNL